MALWTYTTSFESSEGYSTGNLGGQDSWSATASNLTVTTAQAYAGTQSVTGHTDANRSVIRTVTDANTDGTTMYVSMRTTSVVTAVSNAGVFLWGNNGATRIGDIYINAPLAGNISFRQGGGAEAYTVIGTATADTWFRVGIEFDFTNDRVRLNIDNGSFSSYISTGTSFSEVDTMWLVTNGGATNFDVYWDSIGPTYAVESGPANLKSLDTNVKANIKSYNTNVLANIKSINTNV